MALPATGPISLGQINAELGLDSATLVSLNDAALRGLAGIPSGLISLNNFRGLTSSFEFTISSNNTNANLRTLAISAGWDQSSKLVATIASGVYISSNNTGIPALTVSGSFPSGVELINNGYILGMGGAGGNGQAVGSSGLTAGGAGSGGGGGTALSVSSTISVTNNGTIAGGGGGGGGGAAGFSRQPQRPAAYGQSGGGGGGGRSSIAANSSGGSVNQQYATETNRASQAGSPGTSSAAGSGGLGGYDGYLTGGTGGPGGSGGNWGSAGSSGGAYVGNIFVVGGTPGAGGAAGNSVSGIAYVSWVTVGTRLGPTV